MSAVKYKRIRTVTDLKTFIEEVPDGVGVTGNGEFYILKDGKHVKVTNEEASLLLGYGLDTIKRISESKGEFIPEPLIEELEPEIAEEPLAKDLVEEAVEEKHVCECGCEKAIAELTKEVEDLKHELTNLKNEIL